MIRQLVSLVCVSLLAACAGQTSTQVQAMQKKDKQLSCKELLLEMNEAQFYMKAAQKNKGPQLKNILMPLGYISTYMDAQEAIETASARMDYLDKVYNIMDCEKQEASWQAAPVSTYPQAAAPNQQMAVSPAEQRVSAERYMPSTPVPPQQYMQQEPAASAAMADSNRAATPRNQRFW